MRGRDQTRQIYPHHSTPFPAAIQHCDRAGPRNKESQNSQTCRTIDYSDFVSDLYRGLGSQRVPIQGALDLTWRCNLACPHCYNRLPPNDRTAMVTELTYEEHCRILDELSDAGCLWLLFTGGECLLRDDFRKIYTYAKQKGLLITIFTNGTLVTPEIADFLNEWHPFSIEITLYGRTRETYEKVTATPGSYDRCMAAIRLLMEHNLPLSLKTLLLTTNSHEIWAIRDFVEQELGLHFRFDATVNPRVDCSVQPLAFRLDPRQIVELDVMDERRVTDWRELASRQFACSENTQYICGAGMNTCAVNPWGRLRLCSFAGLEGHDLRAGTFREAWEGPLLAERMKQITRLTRCVHCAIRGACGMCPAYGFLENRDTEEPVDFLLRHGAPAVYGPRYSDPFARRMPALRGRHQPYKAHPDCQGHQPVAWFASLRGALIGWDRYRTIFSLTTWNISLVSDRVKAAYTPPEVTTVPLSTNQGGVLGACKSSSVSANLNPGAACSSPTNCNIQGF